MTESIFSNIGNILNKLNNTELNDVRTNIDNYQSVVKHIIPRKITSIRNAQEHISLIISNLIDEFNKELSADSQLNNTSKFENFIKEFTDLYYKISKEYMLYRDSDLVIYDPEDFNKKYEHITKIFLPLIETLEDVNELNDPEKRNNKDFHNELSNIIGRNLNIINDLINETNKIFEDIEKEIIKFNKMVFPNYKQQDIVLLNEQQKSEIDDYTIRIKKLNNEKIEYDKIEGHELGYLLHAINLLKDIEIILTDEKIEAINSFFHTDNEINDTYTQIEKTQSGGYFNNIEEINNKTLDIIEKIDKFMILKSELDKKIKDYSELRENYSYFLIYCFTILKSREPEKIEYIYINRGILSFYNRILSNILKKIYSLTETKDILYFKKYHKFIILRLYSFTSYLIRNINALDIIDINKCSGNILTDFVLLNNFKVLLDIYYENSMDNLTIYARINDFGDASELRDTERLFKPDPRNNRKLIVDESICYQEQRMMNKILFTEVFDSKEIPYPYSISKYMTLESELTKGKGVMLMTYGYSGTGKTYTLFGKIGENDKSMLQGTLNNIRGLENVDIRIFEVYGTGIPYPHYWNNHRNINQKIIHHKISISNDNFVLDDVITISDNEKFEEYSGSNPDDEISYFTKIIGADNVKKLFGKFSYLVNDIDERRIKEGRITETPNNKMSSRSVLVYDIRISTDKEDETKKTPFIIVDLPGREELVPTYIESFKKKEDIGNIYESLNKKDKVIFDTVLLGTTLYPYLFALLDPVLVASIFNNMDDDSRKKVLRNIGDQKFGVHSDTSDLLLKNLMEITSDNKIRMTRNNQIFTKGRFHRRTHRIHYRNNTIMYEVVITLILINKIIEENKTNILNRIKNEFVKKYINRKLGNIRYEHIETPQEGIYINETIMGLQYFLVKDVLQRSEDVVNKVIKEQSTELEFNALLNRFRRFNEEIYYENDNEIMQEDKYIIRDHYFINIQKLNEILNSLKDITSQDSYISSRIFNKQQTLFNSLFSNYLSKISSFKLFYLFSNKDLFIREGEEEIDIKCRNQLQLLNDTTDLLDVINF